MTTLSVLAVPIPLNGIIAVPLVIGFIVLINVISQILFKRRNEPPVVFHWFPIIGCTVTYGIDPFKFFFDCQKKVQSFSSYPDLIVGTHVDSKHLVWGYLYFHLARQEGHRLFGIQG